MARGRSDLGFFLAVGAIGVVLVAIEKNLRPPNPWDLDLESDDPVPPMPTPPKPPPKKMPPIGTDIPGHWMDDECPYWAVDAHSNPIKFNHWKPSKIDRGGTMPPIAQIVAYKTVAGSILVMSNQGAWAEPRLPENVHPEFLAMIQKWKEFVDELVMDPKFKIIPVPWIWAIMWAESRGVQNAKSRCGALGLMQVMPFHFSKNDVPLEPRTNLRAGANWILQGFKRQGMIDLPSTASHYNAGGAGGPYSNASWVAAGKNASYTTQWGVPSEKGYIDSVVRANNTYLSLVGAGKTLNFPEPVNIS